MSGNRRTLPCNTRDRCLEPSLGHVKTECMTDRRTRTSPADSIVTKADTPSTGNCEHMTATTTRRFVLDSWRAGRNPIHHQHRSSYPAPSEEAMVLGADPPRFFRHVARASLLGCTNRLLRDVIGHEAPCAWYACQLHS